MSRLSRDRPGAARSVRRTHDFAQRHRGWDVDPGSRPAGVRRDRRHPGGARGAQRARRRSCSRCRRTRRSWTSGDHRPRARGPGALAPDADRGDDRPRRHRRRVRRRCARTLVLTQPHNPWGRVLPAAELEGLRDVVVQHGARVISDEVHAPLVASRGRARALPEPPGHRRPRGRGGRRVEGVQHRRPAVCADRHADPATTGCGGVPDVPDPSTTLVARSGRWPPSRRTSTVTPGWPRCWTPRRPARPPGRAARRPTCRRCGCARSRRRTSPGSTSAAYDVDDVAELALQKGRVKLAPGHDFHPGLAGHVRLNIATSPERLEEIVVRLASAWTG